MAARLLLRTMGRDDILGELSVCPFGNSVWLRRKKCVTLVGPIKIKDCAIGFEKQLLVERNHNSGALLYYRAVYFNEQFSLFFFKKNSVKCLFFFLKNQWN